MSICSSSRYDSIIQHGLKSHHNLAAHWLWLIFVAPRHLPFQNCPLLCRHRWCWGYISCGNPYRSGSTSGDCEMKVSPFHPLLHHYCATPISVVLHNRKHALIAGGVMLCCLPSIWAGATPSANSGQDLTAMRYLVVPYLRRC